MILTRRWDPRIGGDLIGCCERWSLRCRSRFETILTPPSFAAKRGGRRTASEARRLLGLAAIYDGSRWTEAAKIGRVTLQIVRDWVVRFNPLGPAGLISGKERRVRCRA